MIRYKISGKSVPIAVAWRITGRCNQRCTYCNVKYLRESKELDTKAAKDMIDQMRRAGTLLISFTGGEPLIRKDIGEIIQYVKMCGIICKLNTNGFLVKSWLNDLRRLDLLQISVDGPPDIQDRLRGKGSSEMAGRAIMAARQAGIKIQVITCLTRDNISYIDDVLNYGLSLNTGLCFQPLSTNFLNNEEIDSSVPEKDDLIQVIQYLIELKQNRAAKSKAIGSTITELKYYLDHAQNNRRGCNCALMTAMMFPDGHMVFCGEAKNYKSYDAVTLGFARAFSCLTIPDCDGCVCVGKLRFSKLYQLNISVMREMFKL